jgi:hypothetical protein
MTEEVVGKFTIERTEAKYGGYRTVVVDEGGKQVGSTFDDDIGDKLAGYPEGAVIAVEVDKSGRFWEIVGAGLSDSGSAKSSPKTAKPGSYGSEIPFGERDLTYFMGNSARVIAAYIRASKEYVDQVENTENPIETIHKDVVFGAKLLLNEANRKG